MLLLKFNGVLSRVGLDVVKAHLRHIVNVPKEAEDGTKVKYCFRHFSCCSM